MGDPAPHLIIKENHANGWLEVLLDLVKKFSLRSRGLHLTKTLGYATYHIYVPQKKKSLLTIVQRLEDEGPIFDTNST